MRENSTPLKLEDLEIYRLSLEVGEIVWNIVERWEYLNKKHPGRQFTEAADSIAANIAEGHGRYFFKEKKLFCYYSRGSILESKTWAYKSCRRNLMTRDEYLSLLEKLKTLHFKLNVYIKTLKKISNTSIPNTHILLPNPILLNLHDRCDVRIGYFLPNRILH
ncbi:MAG: four helix bundle protein [Saprospiraceae bacterium]